MACTTILVGKKASYNGSTLIARNDDSPSGVFCAKKLVVIEPSKQPRKYKSKIAHLKIDLPDNPLRYTSMPSVDKSEGVWAAAGINSANVGMTATETITTNPRVMGADPLVVYQPKSKGKKEVPGGIGEEDLVVLTLPYITSARQGVMRLGSLLEKYGTYEANGIAFNDKDEVWWLESIGGHNWIACKVKDEEVVIMPNQFGLDKFDFNDAYEAQNENICSRGLKDLVENNFLDLSRNKEEFNPRLAFGSHDDSDHVYNTPRAWYMGRYLTNKSIKWDGSEARYTPLSDDIPWSLIPDTKVTIEDIKYLLSSYYQGTPYTPYSKVNDPLKGIYRPIGISRTSFLAILEIRNNVKKEYSAIEWVSFGSNAFNAIVPLYTNTSVIPTYFTNTTSEVNTNNFYWVSRLIGALADSHFNLCSVFIERYQNTALNKGHELLNKYDALLNSSSDTLNLINKANKEVEEMIKKETNKALDKILYTVSCQMKNGYNRSDN